MRLARVARAFDRMPCTDAYTGQFLFNGQLNLYDDSKRDAEATERRVISTDQGVPMPKRGVVAAAGTRWIIGHANPDSFKGSVIRVGHVAHEATFLAQVRTLGQACRGETGLRAYCGGAWIKNLADSTNSSELAPQFHMHFAAVEKVAVQHLLYVDGSYYVARSSHVGPAGTRIVLCDYLSDPALVDATLRRVTMNAVTEVRTQVDTTVRVIFARWQSLFEYNNHVAPKFGPGQIQIVIAKAAATPVAGDFVVYDGDSWQIESALEEGDVWICKGVLQ